MEDFAYLDIREQSESVDWDRWSTFISYFKSKDLLRSMNQEGSRLPFTSAMVRIAESKDLNEQQKLYGMLGGVIAFEDFCRKYSDRIPKEFQEGMGMLMHCAKNDIKNGEYYLAISDIESAESNYLFDLNKELSEIDAPDVRKSLIEKMANSELKMRGYDSIRFEYR